MLFCFDPRQDTQTNNIFHQKQNEKRSETESETREEEKKHTPNRNHTNKYEIRLTYLTVRSQEQQQQVFSGEVCVWAFFSMPIRIWFILMIQKQSASKTEEQPIKKEAPFENCAVTKSAWVHWNCEIEIRSSHILCWAGWRLRNGKLAMWNISISKLQYKSR